MHYATYRLVLLPFVVAFPFNDLIKKAVGRSVDPPITYPYSAITISDHKIFWGCNVDPIKELDYLGEICHESGQCLEDDADAYERDIKYLDPGAESGTPPVDKILRIRASGRYETPLRNGLVAAIQAAANATGMIRWHRQVKWSWVGTPGCKVCSTPNDSGVCDIAELSTAIGINLYKSAGPNNGNDMQAIIEIVDVDVSKGACKGLDYSAAIAGAFGAAGAGLAAIFGTIKAGCQT